jgi:cation-transporting ATPase E
VYAYLYRFVADSFASGRTPSQITAAFEGYTGLPYTDTDFATASSTIAAQTGRSTFVCLVVPAHPVPRPTGSVLRRLDQSHR